ncbi:MAG: alpha/beta hydrolase [Owenweeksia sp.]|nr:alpha/beta hydrolase [Owenweeksia sp.]
MNVINEYKQRRNKLLEDRGIQFQSKYVATNGPVENVHYLELGSGFPMIMVHGGGSHSGEWIDILKPLAKNFHLFVVDRPGCGLTDKIDYNGKDVRESAVDFIHSFVNAIGREKVLLPGHSMGGYFSICFALKHPERVKKLLLIGAPGGMNALDSPIFEIDGNQIFKSNFDRNSCKAKPKKC